MLKNNTINLTKCISIPYHPTCFLLFSCWLVCSNVDYSLFKCKMTFLLQQIHTIYKKNMLLNCHWHLQICIIFKLQWLFPQLWNYFHTTTFKTHACISFKYLLYNVNNKTQFMQEWPAAVAALRHHNDTFVSCGEHHVSVWSHTLPTFREVK